MIDFILNDTEISTSEPAGTTVLDFVRYHKDLKGTKIGCREGDCGACTVMVGELVGNEVKYRTMTSCLMPLANAAGKHIVTVEGINPQDGSMTPVQQAMVDESGTQCGFCTVGFVMSLTNFCVDETANTPEMAISAVDGNICRCTGYKSIERAAMTICGTMAEPPASAGGVDIAIENGVVPKYFADITSSLKCLIKSPDTTAPASSHPLTRAVPPFVSGGTDLYVQKPEHMAESNATPLLYDEQLRGIRDLGEHIEIGGSATVTDLLVSPVMRSVFPQLNKHLKLVSSTPIRNMATLAGNFVNASPIGDMTVWFLALNAEIDLVGVSAASRHSPQSGEKRTLSLKDLYLGYKQIAKQPDEMITAIRFKKPGDDFRFNFEKVCKRTYLDIATVNTAMSLSVASASADALMITGAHVSAGGVGPIPLYLNETSAFLIGKTVNEETITAANEIMQSEISPISDVRGTEQYKRLLLRQLFRHFACHVVL
ncbi:MAG: FAD binding domain-containing protein [Chloracidobacterium sp.]|nr:FAD binding domain-containing protein [Chloracidobacterium sp.]